MKHSIAVGEWCVCRAIRLPGSERIWRKPCSIVVSAGWVGYYTKCGEDDWRGTLTLTPGAGSFPEGEGLRRVAKTCDSEYVVAFRQAVQTLTYPQFSPHPCHSLICHSEPDCHSQPAFLVSCCHSGSCADRFFLSFPRRRESRSLWQTSTQIALAGIHILDHVHLPNQSPFSDLFLALHRLFRVPMLLIVYKPIDPSRQIVGRTDLRRHITLPAMIYT